MTRRMLSKLVGLLLVVLAASPTISSSLRSKTMPTWVFDAVFSDDGKDIVVRGNEIYVLDASTLRIKKTIASRSLGMSRNGDYYVALRPDKQIELRSIRSDDAIAVLPGFVDLRSELDDFDSVLADRHGVDIQDFLDTTLAVISNDALYVGACSTENRGGMFRVWHVPSKELLFSQESSEECGGMGFTRDDKYAHVVYEGSRYKSPRERALLLLNLSTREVVRHSIANMRFDQVELFDGYRRFAGMNNFAILFGKIEERVFNEAVRELHFAALNVYHDQRQIEMRKAALNHAGTMYATAIGESRLKLGVWDPRGSNSKPIARIEGNGDAFISVAFSPDDSLIVTTSFSRQVTIWQTPGGPSGRTVQRPPIEAIYSTCTDANDAGFCRCLVEHVDRTMTDSELLYFGRYYDDFFRMRSGKKIGLSVSNERRWELVEATNPCIDMSVGARRYYASKGPPKSGFSVADLERLRALASQIARTDEACAKASSDCTVLCASTKVCPGGAAAAKRRGILGGSPRAEYSVPSRYQRVFARVSKGMNFEQSHEKKMFVAGVAAYMLDACNLLDSSDREDVRSYIWSAIGTGGPVPSVLVDAAETVLSASTAMAAGHNLGRSMACRLPDSLIFLKGLDLAIEETEPNSLFASTCQLEMAREDCECIEKYGRTILPDFQSRPYSQDLISEITKRNPAAVALMAAECGVRQAGRGR